MKMHWQKYVAELLGAGVLTLAVLVTLKFPTAVATPLAAGLTLGLFVYTIGSVSGSHINPAVTLGLWSVRKIETFEAVLYIIAQILGGFLAMTAFSSLFGELPTVNAASVPMTFVGEAVGAFLFLLGIMAVVSEKVKPGAAGVVIGGSLLLGILIASPLSNGVLNPAVAIGIRSLSWAYILGPIAGAIVSCWFARWLLK